MSISERASAGVVKPAPQKPKPQRVCCPNCEAEFDLSKTNVPRSPEQHRRFWALMKAAFYHWPESHDEQFVTMNDLRLWLTMKAGWRDEVARLPVSGMKIEHAKVLAEAAILAAGGHARAVAHKGVLVIFKPRSIRFDRMKHLEFCALNDAVSATIESETPLRVAELLQEGIAG